MLDEVELSEAALQRVFVELPVGQEGNYNTRLPGQNSTNSNNQTECLDWGSANKEDSIWECEKWDA